MGDVRSAGDNLHVRLALTGDGLLGWGPPPVRPALTPTGVRTGLNGRTHRWRRELLDVWKSHTPSVRGGCASHVWEKAQGIELFPVLSGVRGCSGLSTVIDRRQLE